MLLGVSRIKLLIYLNVRLHYPSLFFIKNIFNKSPLVLNIMKIAICGSLNFTHEIKRIADELLKLNFDVHIPISSEKILQGEFSLDEIKQEKENGKFADRAIKYDSIREYWKIIKESDAILIANFDKNSIKNYIGGNSFLEMGFAHILNKPIYLLNDIPSMIYTDEIRAMQPIVINGDLFKINNKK